MNFNFIQILIFNCIGFGTHLTNSTATLMFRRYFHAHDTKNSCIWICSEDHHNLWLQLFCMYKWKYDLAKWNPESSCQFDLLVLIIVYHKFLQMTNIDWNLKSPAIDQNKNRKDRIKSIINLKEQCKWGHTDKTDYWSLRSNEQHCMSWIVYCYFYFLIR